MNKVLQINVGGISFTIDDDAYRKLDAYLHELELHFKYSDSSEEILSDIEARLAELLTDRLRGREIISVADVLATIKIMGKPNQFEDAFIESEPRHRSWDLKTGRKLYRDPENKVIGGVCSGLAAYFGVEDPIWVRLAFVLVFFTLGFGMLLYIILWVMVPEAKTAGDRLAMMGEPANVHNISRMIERGIDDLSETLKDNWNEFKSKKKSDHTAGVHSVRDSGKSWLLALILLPLRIIRWLVKGLLGLMRGIARRRAGYYYEKHPFV